MKWKLILIAAAFMLLPSLARAQLVPSVPQSSSTAEYSHTFSGNKLLALSVAWTGTSARYLMIFNQTTVPTGGGGSVIPAECDLLPNSTTSPGSQRYSWVSSPLWLPNGITVVVSTTGCGTLTYDSAEDWFSGVQTQ